MTTVITLIALGGAFTSTSGVGVLPVAAEDIQMIYESNNVFEKVFDARWSNARKTGVTTIRGFRCVNPGAMLNGKPVDNAAELEFLDFDPQQEFPSISSAGLWTMDEKNGLADKIPSYVKNSFDDTCYVAFEQIDDRRFPPEDEPKSVTKHDYIYFGGWQEQFSPARFNVKNAAGVTKEKVEQLRKDYPDKQEMWKQWKDSLAKMMGAQRFRRIDMSTDETSRDDDGSGIGDPYLAERKFDSPDDKAKRYKVESGIETFTDERPGGFASTTINQDDKFPMYVLQALHSLHPHTTHASSFGPTTPGAKFWNAKYQTTHQNKKFIDDYDNLSSKLDDEDKPISIAIRDPLESPGNEPISARYDRNNVVRHKKANDEDMLQSFVDFKNKWDPVSGSRDAVFSNWKKNTNLNAYADVTVGVRFANVSVLFCKKESSYGVGKACQNLCKLKAKVPELKYVPVVAVESEYKSFGRGSSSSRNVMKNGVNDLSEVNCKTDGGLFSTQQSKVVDNIFALREKWADQRGESTWTVLPPGVNKVKRNDENGWTPVNPGGPPDEDGKDGGKKDGGGCSGAAIAAIIVVLIVIVVVIVVLCCCCSASADPNAAEPTQGEEQPHSPGMGGPGVDHGPGMMQQQQQQLPGMHPGMQHPGMHPGMYQQQQPGMYQQQRPGMYQQYPGMQQQPGMYQQSMQQSIMQQPQQPGMQQPQQPGMQQPQSTMPHEGTPLLPPIGTQ
jgi:hypothetical protein